MPRWPFSGQMPPPQEPTPRSAATDKQPGRDHAAGRQPQPSPSDPGEADERTRLKQDLAELMTAHRHQGRVLERSQKQLEQTEQELTQLKTRSGALEREIAEQRTLATQRALKIQELEQQAGKHATLAASYEAIDRERKDLQARIAELTQSRAAANAESDRLTADLTSAHATIAARDAEIAALKVEQEAAEEKLNQARSELETLKKETASVHAELERAIESQAGHHRLQLEFEALSARWEVAREQLAEAEQALKTSQATIKAAQKLSSSVEWRNALDGILDAASELVRFERGTLALVDELQKELKV